LGSPSTVPKDKQHKKTHSQRTANATEHRSKHAKTAAIILTILAIFTRFYKISEPAQVVFDEVHFGKFASYYLRHTYYFDVHPPLGKLMLAGAGWAGGYNGSYLFDKIGNGNHDSPVANFQDSAESTTR